MEELLGNTQNQDLHNLHMLMAKKFITIKATMSIASKQIKENLNKVKFVKVILIQLLPTIISIKI